MNPRSSLIFASFVSLGLAIVVLLFWFLFSGLNLNPILMPLYLVMLGCMSLLAYGGKQWLSRLDPGGIAWLHPPLLITIWWLVAYSLPGFYGFVDYNFPSPLRTRGFQPVFAVEGTLLTLVGMILMWVGYLLALQFWSPLTILKRLSQQVVSLSPVVIFYGVAVLMQIVQIRITGIAYGSNVDRLGVYAPFQQWLGYAQSINTLMLSTTALQVFRRKWSLTPLIIMLIIGIGFSFISGFMKPLFWLGVLMTLGVIYTRFSMRRFVLPLMILGALGILVVPVSENLRTRVDRGEYNTRDIRMSLDATTQAISVTSSQGLQASLQLVFDRFMYRQMLVAYTPGIIMELTPSRFPYQGIEQFLAIPFYVVPRALWPEKPVLSRGNWFAITYLGQPSFLTSSAAITVFGEAYMFVGWLGAALATLSFGVLLGFLYRQLVSSGLLAVFLATTPTFLDVEGQFMGIFVATIQITVVYLLAYWLIVMISSRTGSFAVSASQESINASLDQSV